jgi:hypothetical protein
MKGYLVFLLFLVILVSCLGIDMYRYDRGQWIKLPALNEYGSVETIGEETRGYCNKSVWDIGVSVSASIETPPNLRFSKQAVAVTPNIEILPDGTFRVPNNQYAEWQVTIQLISDSPIDNVVVEDNFGGEFGVELISVSKGAVEFNYSGATKKVSIKWIIGDDFSNTATLILKVYTDKNPANKQEFTSRGSYSLNSGAVLKYRIGNTGYSIKTPSIKVRAQ